MNRIVVFKKEGILSSILFRASVAAAVEAPAGKRSLFISPKKNFVAEVFLPVNFFKRFLHLKRKPMPALQPVPRNHIC